MSYYRILCAIFVISVFQYGNATATCSNGTKWKPDTNQCIACEPGHYLVSVELHNITSCTLCASGWFQPNSGQNHCLECVYTTGFLESSTDRTFCKYNCWRGSYYNRTTGNYLDCPIGFYTDTLGSESCTECPAGKSTLSGTRTSINDCIVDIPPTTSTAKVVSILANIVQTTDKSSTVFVAFVPNNIYNSTYTATAAPNFNPIYSSTAISLKSSIQTVTLVTSAYTDDLSGISEFFRSSRNAAITALVGGLIIGAGVGICIHAFTSRRHERVVYVERPVTSNGVSA